MLPDVGGSEWLLIAAAALIFIGPKDLPPLLRKLGQFVGKMRGMASEFRMSFDEMARHSELEELRREVNAMRAERPFAHDDLNFRERPVGDFDASSQSSAALDASAVSAPVTEPEEPTLFDLDGHDAGVHSPAIHDTATHSGGIDDLGAHGVADHDGSRHAAGTHDAGKTS